MRKKFLSTPKRRIGFIVSIPLAIIVFSYVGGIIIQALNLETGTAEARALAWLFLIIGVLGVYTVLCLLVFTVYLCVAIHRWIQTGRWLTPSEYEWEIKKEMKEEKRRNARAH